MINRARAFCALAHTGYFYSSDRPEPPHIDVERDDDSTKFWLAPVRMEWNDRFSQRELRRIETLIEENVSSLIEAWNEYFRD